MTGTRLGDIARWGWIICQRTGLRLRDSVRQSMTYAQANMRMFALIEILGQPIYYILWVYVYPQPHDSIGLRATCVLLSLPMLYPDRIRGQVWERVFVIYWIFSLIFQLPFFFVYMSLINNFSMLWALSTMAALTMMVLLVYDWLMTLLLAAAGVTAAWVVFKLNGGVLGNPPESINALFWTYAFGLIVGTGLNYKTELVSREKLSAITDAVGTIAHELRTPLLGIRSGARGLNQYLPILVQGYLVAREHGLDVPSIRHAHIGQINSVLGRIESETEYTNVVLDMLLVNSSRTVIDDRAFEKVCISECVEEALSRYPFHSAAERELIEGHLTDDFVFRGSQIFMVHVLFNLIKNALYQLARSERGKIRIWTISRPEARVNELHFRDTGPGIPAAVLPRIFDRFYSGMPRGLGTGIGLAFARLVIESFSGQIFCESIEGEYAEFIIRLPEYESHETG